MSSPVLNVDVPGRRLPAGLIVAAIVLALIACWGLFASGSVILVGLTVHTAQTARYPAIAAIQVAMGSVMLLASCFCALTVYGLFRLQRWARFSVIILGGLLALLSSASALLFIWLAFSPALTHAPGANVSPAFLKTAFVGMGAFSMGVSCLGVWWLIYFNLRRIRVVFDPQLRGLALEPNVDGLAAGGEVHTVAPADGMGVIEVLLNCLAVLYLFGAATGIVVAAMHLPIFLLGVILRGGSGVAAMLAFCGLNVAIGIGLLRRLKAGWMAAFAFQSFGLLSSLLLLVPRNRNTLAQYSQEVIGSMVGKSGLAQPPGQPAQNISYVPSILLAAVLTGVIFWLLVRARPLFEAKWRVM